jgi:hypothetical protein
MSIATEIEAGIALLEAVMPVTFTYDGAPIVAVDSISATRGVPTENGYTSPAQRTIYVRESRLTTAGKDPQADQTLSIGSKTYRIADVITEPFGVFRRLELEAQYE